MVAVDIALGVAVGLVLGKAAEIGMISVIKTRQRKALKHDLEEVASDFIDHMHKEHMAEKEAAEAKAAKRRKPATKKAPVKKPVATTKKTVTKKGK